MQFWYVFLQLGHRSRGGYSLTPSRTGESSIEVYKIVLIYIHTPTVVWLDYSKFEHVPLKFGYRYLLWRPDEYVWSKPYDGCVLHECKFHASSLSTTKQNIPSAASCNAKKYLNVWVNLICAHVSRMNSTAYLTLLHVHDLCVFFVQERLLLQLEADRQERAAQAPVTRGSIARSVGSGSNVCNPAIAPDMLLRDSCTMIASFSS